MSVGIEKNTPVINTIEPWIPTGPFPPFATSNRDKLSEIAASLGIEVNGLDWLGIDVPEIQDTEPNKVAIAKAKSAYEAAGGIPVIVEDTSLRIPTLEALLPPTFVKYWADGKENKEQVCQLAQARGDNRATAQTIFAVYDGQNTHLRIGQTDGTIAEVPRGSGMFGWDDIFIPNGQDVLEGYDGTNRTFAEMTLKEKQQFSMRQEALQQLQTYPLELGIWVHALAPALQMEIDAIDNEFFKGPEMEVARRHAYGLRSLMGVEPREDLSIDIKDLPPFHEKMLHPEIMQYSIDPTSPDLGLIITAIDRRKLPNGQETRVLQNPDGRSSFLQHGKKSYTRALAARAYEFAIHHNPEMYAMLRNLIKKKTTARPHVRSAVIESLLGMGTENETGTDEDIITFSVPGFTDLAYARESSDHPTSRTQASMNHILNRNGIPTSIFALGGMPPVTGSKDVVTTAALSFMRSYIPHNSLFVDFDRRLAMFEECKEHVESMIPGEENGDIRQIAVAQIGVCMSGKDIPAIANQTHQLIEKGCGSVRIYTTNPGPEVIEAARAIGEKAKNEWTPNNTLPFHVCVGPIVDEKQANKLRKISEEYGFALTLIAGHGGGENCTSLEGGAAANAIEIIYNLSLKKKFKNVSLGFEGGLGTWFGPWMGRIEQISKDGSMVRGAVETQGGLCVLHKSGAAVQPYSGTASPYTQMIEQALFPDVKRTNPAGQLKNNEGKPGYTEASHWAPSIVHNFSMMRSMLGRVLADQQSSSIDQIIRKIKKNGNNLRVASPGAVATAKSHRPM